MEDSIGLFPFLDKIKVKKELFCQRANQDRNGKQIYCKGKQQQLLPFAKFLLSFSMLIKESIITPIHIQVQSTLNISNTDILKYL